MERGIDQDIAAADQDVGEVRAAGLPGEDLERAVASGELTQAQANEELQAAARRHAAEHGPDMDTDEDGRVTSGGFGSGQGMASQSGSGRPPGSGSDSD